MPHTILSSNQKVPCLDIFPGGIQGNANTYCRSVNLWKRQYVFSLEMEIGNKVVRAYTTGCITFVAKFCLVTVVCDHTSFFSNGNPTEKVGSAATGKHPILSQRNSQTMCM